MSHLLNTKEILLNAQAQGYAVPAFNIHNLETAQSVIDAAVDMRSPLIIAVTPSTMSYAGHAYIHAIAEVATKAHDIPIALHLDHHKTVDSIQTSLTLGVRSVMIDGSDKSLEENIAISKEVVELAHGYDATVEAELGQFGNAKDGIEGQYTDPDIAAEFVARTNVDSLAVAIGTGHGVYDVEPKLDFDRLAAIRSKIDVPIVLHGASGLSKEDLRKCISLGCTKVNVSTELKIPFTETLRNYLIDHPNESDIRIYMQSARKKMKEAAMHKIVDCLSDGKA